MPPHGLSAGVNCVSYQDCIHLQNQLDALDSNPTHYEEMLKASSDWVRGFTTIAAAQRLIDAVLSQ